MIYFARCLANGLIKIGYTGRDDVAYRFELLVASSPVPVNLIGAVPGDREFEKSMHVAFTRWWHHNEWFEPSEQLLAFIAREVPPWLGEPPMRDLCAVNARRRSELLAIHDDRYGSEECSFEGACSDCGEFMGPGRFLPGSTNAKNPARILRSGRGPGATFIVVARLMPLGSKPSAPGAAAAGTLA